VAAVVAAPPASFRITVPTGWITPAQARVAWEPPHSTFGGLRYALVVDGIVAKRDLPGSAVRLERAGLGDGRHAVQVIATDATGQQTATESATIQVDGVAPTAAVRHVRGQPRKVRLVVADAGVDRQATSVRYGDGSRAARGGSALAHAYRRRGTFAIVATVRDRIGHRAVRRLHVTVR
jgi:hypothetical protein